MLNNRVAADVLGTMGTVCWSGQLLPQIWKSWRSKSTEGLSPWLMLLWAVGSAFMAAYAFIAKLNIPLTIQPHLFGFLCLVSWGQTLYYGKKYSALKAAAITCGVITLVGALEILLVFTIKTVKEPHNRDQGALAVAIISSILLAIALLPQYWEIYQLRAVVGLSITFIAIDTLGGILNDLSLVFEQTFDVLAAVQYSIVVVLDGVILVIALVFKVVEWRWRRKGTVDDTEDAMIAANDEPQASTALQKAETLTKSTSRTYTPSRSGQIPQDLEKDPTEGLTATRITLEDVERVQV